MTNIAKRDIIYITKRDILGGDIVREYLVKLRESRGLTQVDAAKKLLISQSYLSGLETGGRKKSLSLATLKAFARTYKTPLERLVAEESRYNDFQQRILRETI